MTADEHQRERMRAWITFRISQFNGYGLSAHDADERLAEFDKRFPAPAAVEVASVPVPTAANPTVPTPERIVVVGHDRVTGEVIQAQTVDPAELTTLREKARLWDAVASGKVRLDWTDHGYAAFYGEPGTGNVTDRYYAAEKAVQAAIDAGALK